MSDDYPQDAIDRVLNKPGAGRHTAADVDLVHAAAGCPHPTSAVRLDVTRALARGLEAQRALDEIEEAMQGLLSRAKDCRFLVATSDVARSVGLLGKASAYEHAHELLAEAMARAGRTVTPRP